MGKIEVRNAMGSANSFAPGAPSGMCLSGCGRSLQEGIPRDHGKEPMAVTGSLLGLMLTRSLLGARGQ